MTRTVFLDGLITADVGEETERAPVVNRRRAILQEIGPSIKPVKPKPGVEMMPISGVEGCGSPAS